VVYLLKPGDLSRKLPRKQVQVFDFPDGTIDIRYQGRSLPFSTFDKVRQVKQAELVGNKWLGAVLQHCQELQAAKSINRSQRAPARQAQVTQLQERAVNPAAWPQNP